MKPLIKHFTGILLFFLLNQQVFSQIIIDQTDMPSAGDTLRVSSTIQVPPGYAEIN